MKSKKIIFAIFAFLIFAFAGLLLFKKTNIFKNNEESSNNQINDVAVISQNSNEFVFVGDDSYLIKGKLTDEKFRDIYEKLPDTLYQLEFNDRIFAMDKTDDVNDMTFSLIQENSLKNLDTFQGTGEQENLIKYLKLAVNGKATYPKISSLANRFESLIDPEEFHTKYADYFIETSDNYGMSALPSGIKLKLIEFFNSDEGKNYRYRTKGNQTSRDLMWSGELTGLNKKEMAILLNDTRNNLEDRYMLLVYALPDQPRAQQYYLVYNEVFYDKVLMDHLKYSADGEDYSEEIYMNTDTKVTTPYNGILLKQVNAPDYALVYDKNFDKMIKYIQQPKSQPKAENEVE